MHIAQIRQYLVEGVPEGTNMSEFFPGEEVLIVRRDGVKPGAYRVETLLSIQGQSEPEPLEVDPPSETVTVEDNASTVLIR